MVAPQYSPKTEYLEQLTGERLEKFLRAIEFCSDGQKVKNGAEVGKISRSISN